jgi:deoxyribose-phosphate aldolase
MPLPYSYPDIAGIIDHSLLGPALTDAELEAGCRLACRYGVASVCILPYYAARCTELLTGSPVHSSTTIGFPHGGHATSVKLAEVRQTLTDGAAELDMVINISKVRSRDWKYVADEIRTLTEATHAGGAKIKVIFENAYLDDAMKIRLCEICGEIGVDMGNPQAPQARARVAGHPAGRPGPYRPRGDRHVLVPGQPAGHRLAADTGRRRRRPGQR